VAFIDMFKSQREGKGGLLWRVEPICKVLTGHYGVSISPSGYYGYKKRGPSARELRDARLKALIVKVWEENFSCWGALKTWRELRRRGKDVARCTVERLMRGLCLRGLHRARTVRTTIAGKNARSAADLVRRDFWAAAPNRLWVADFTYVSTWEGWCYTAFITDVFARRVIGWAVSAKMSKELVAAAFKMAVFIRHNEGHMDLSDLIHHNDMGSQYTSDSFGELLALHGIRASIGSVGDSFDNALAETMNGAYKTELIYNPNKGGPWKTLEQLETATAEWVWWHNNKNITEHNDWHTPIEIEEMLYNDGVDARKGSVKAKA
jgi:putative transposase